jgi:sugar lactone lactonase YvrE
MLASFSKRASLLGAGMWAIPGGTISTKEKAVRRADRSGLLMKSPNLSGCVVAAFTLLSFGSAMQGQTLPSYVVDAQVPIVSSDGFNDPQGLGTVPGGTVYVADSGNHRLLKIAPDGTQTTVSFGVSGLVAQTMSGLAIDAVGDLFVADTATNRLFKLPAGGGHAVVILGAPLMDRPTAVASDAAGDVAVVNSGNATVVVRRYGPAAVLNTGSTVLAAPTAVAFDSKGLVYVADAGNGTTPGAVYKFPVAGGTGAAVPLTGYALKNVTGLVLDAQNNLFVLDAGSEELIEVPVGGGAAFLIPQSNFKSPSGLTLDNLGNIYVSDSGTTSNTVTKLVYNNAANFGSVQVGATSKAITVNYEFYEQTVVEATRGVGGGVPNADYRKAAGGTCALRTYFPTTSSTGLTLPASCNVNIDFQPVFVGGRPGAAQVQTSNGNVNQLTIGIGLGAQLALMDATTTTKVASVGTISSLAVNAGDTEIYYATAAGTYKVPVVGATPTLVTTETGSDIALNGAGDLFIFSAPKITKIPADGSASTVINVLGLINPQSMAMDSNGAFYISDLGPPQAPPDYILGPGFVMRVSSTGVASKWWPANFWGQPGMMIADTIGDIYVADDEFHLIYEVPVWTGAYASTGTVGPELGGIEGSNPINLAVDASGTLYFWDNLLSDGLDYSPPKLLLGALALPYFTVPEYVYPEGTEPFFAQNPDMGAHIATSANGDMFAFDGTLPGLYRINRTLASMPQQVFDPNTLYSGLVGPNAYVYNVGNQNATFTQSAAFTESGNGVGTFTFGTACRPGTVIAPGDNCAIGIIDANATGKGTIVEDTLHFLTNAVNNNSVSLRIYGFAEPAP